MQEYVPSRRFDRILYESDRRAFVMAILVPLLASALFFFNDYQQKKKVAKYFTDILRYEIIKGSTRDAVFQSQRMVVEDGPFYRIRYTDFNQMTIIDQTTREATPLIKNSIEFPVLFEDEGMGKSAGILSYQYSLEAFVGFSLVFFLASLVISTFYLIKQRRLISAKFEQEIRSQKNEAIARTINNLAHDLKAPLNVMEIFLERFANDSREDFKAAKQGLMRIKAMIDSLHHNDSDQIVRTSFGQLDITYVLQTLQTIAAQNGKRLTIEGNSGLMLSVDHPKVERVIQNLGVNAIEAAKSEVKIQFATVGHSFHMVFKDDGDGVAKHLIPTLYERGATFGKQGGTGIGLSFCKSVLNGHGGSLQYFRASDWTVFQAELPVYSNRSNYNDVSSEVKHTKRDVSVGLILRERSLETLLKDKILKTFGTVKVSAGVDSAIEADIVLVDSLETIASLNNKNQSILIVRQDERLEFLIERIRIKVDSLT